LAVGCFSGIVLISTFLPALSFVAVSLTYGVVVLFVFQSARRFLFLPRYPRCISSDASFRFPHSLSSRRGDSRVHPDFFLLLQFLLVDLVALHSNLYVLAVLFLVLLFSVCFFDAFLILFRDELLSFCSSISAISSQFQALLKEICGSI
jgi:hypothetical protein